MTSYIANIKDERIDHHVIILSCDEDLSKLRERELRNEVVIYHISPVESPKVDAKKTHSFFH
ncbi:MAG: hypothetical protein V1678_01215 [Candidatus Aenigmatarchaeota archaeon]